MNGDLATGLLAAITLSLTGRPYPAHASPKIQAGAMQNARFVLSMPPAPRSSEKRAWAALCPAYQEIGRALAANKYQQWDLAFRGTRLNRSGRAQGRQLFRYCVFAIRQPRALANE